MRIEIDDLSRPEVLALLDEHLRDMHALSPPESVHALDAGRLREPGITFWSVWDGPVLLGCGALAALDAGHGEVKSMRTPAARRGRGVGRAVLAHIVEVAGARGYERLSLETGSMAAFEPARRLYERFGFVRCGPFGDYVEDPNSVFMTLRLAIAAPHRVGGDTSDSLRSAGLADARTSAMRAASHPSANHAAGSAATND